MSASTYSPRVGVYGSNLNQVQANRGCGLWAAGYEPVLNTAGATPVPLRLVCGRAWEEALEGVDGVVFADSTATTPTQQANEAQLCEWCRELCLPLLAIDNGMHVLNTTFGGTVHLDLPRELPTALQHQHVPEDGDRHAILVAASTVLCRYYGEGEIIVNSEHRRAIAKVARGFQVSGRALDGVIEAIEAELEGWFALGVQWHPASATASGLDIQLFRGFVEACLERRQATAPGSHLIAA